ncbi:MAG: T9SS type A sorting domain-containing protein [Ignavibacteria bacterium]|nr:T9SS type A sorting domain-containing protein [Ignavibacteria bacterium]
MQRNFSNVAVGAHGFRETGRDSLYRMPFKAGVVTAMDVLYSLQDHGDLSVVGKAYYTRLAQKVQDSWRVQEIGFPGIGSAHGSGRHGFVYTTGNDTPAAPCEQRQDHKQHVHSDIVVLHAPDFALWRWIELGNPYYETNDPTGLEELDADFNARDKGFRLQRPFPLPADNAVHLPFAVFEQGRYRMDLIDLSGRHISTILEREISDVGIHETSMDLTALVPGVYFVRLSNGQSSDTQRLVISGGGRSGGAVRMPLGLP